LSEQATEGLIVALGRKEFVSKTISRIKIPYIREANFLVRRIVWPSGRGRSGGR
jgi:preprotein translocase subunit SecE